MLDPEVLEEEKLWAQQVVTNAKSILTRSKKIASGRLVNSLAYRIDPQGKIIFTYALEGKWVTLGRKKHPGRGVNPKGQFVANIKEWAKIKGLKGRDSKGRFISDDSLAYLIARGINNSGIEPLPFMKIAIGQAIKQLGKSLKTSVAKAEVKKFKAAIKKGLKP
jgi:hypothetical protein